MIEIQKVIKYQVGDEFYDTLEEAQVGHEITTMKGLIDDFIEDHEVYGSLAILDADELLDGLHKYGLDIIVRDSTL